MQTQISPADPAWVVLLAAGAGTRLQDKLQEPKQFLLWRNLPLYWHSAQIFNHCACVEGIVFVFPELYMEQESKRVAHLCQAYNFGLPYKIAAGGKLRQDSALAGVRLVPEMAKKILVHDAARPFLSAKLVWQLCEAIDQDCACAIPGIPVKDTIKLIDGRNRVKNTLHRADLRAIQTPQAFNAESLRKLLTQPLIVTDESAFFEANGFAVKVIDGDEENLKITTAPDLAKLKMSQIPCAGFGYDVHRYGSGRPLKLGGVSIPGNFEVIAHSDGDVLLHALCDAILGCACLGDIGQHFPDNDRQYDNINSAILLDRCLNLAKRKGVTIVQADLTVVCQKPKLSPWRDEIKKNIARLLGLEKDHVNFKATTEESLGFTGNLEGLKAYALVTGLRDGLY